MLAGGTYDLGGTPLDVFDQITIRPGPGAGRRQITATGEGAIDLFTPGVTIRGLLLSAVDVPCCGAVVDIVPSAGGALIDRTIVLARGTSERGIDAGGGVTIRNSAAYVEADFGAAIAGSSGGARLVNVTAVSDPSVATAVGILANACYGAHEIEVVNSIVRGGDDDLSLYEACPNDVSVEIDYSNYDSAYVEGPGPTLVEGPDNQSDPPLLENPATGDFDQLADSPTVNAGSNAAAEGEADLGGDPRINGPAVDIGADELVEDSAAPALRILGRRLVLRRNRVTTVRLRCPASEASPPCRGKLRAKTRKRVRIGGRRRAAKLATTRYRIGGGETQRVRLRLSKRSARLVRRNRKARKIRVLTQVRDGAGNGRRVVRAMRIAPR